MSRRAMRKAVLITALALLAPAAYADPIPDYILNKDYDNCVKGATQDPDPAKRDPDAAKHCDCIRTSMRSSWSLDDYGDMVMAQLKNSSQVPEKLQTLAKSCFNQK